MALSKPQPAHGRRQSMGSCSAERTARLFEPRLVVRQRARVRRLTLDRALAAGEDASASPLLAARAAQLVDPNRRQRIAGYLEQFAFTADAPRGRVRTLPLQAAVRPNQQALFELARILAHDGLHYARGIAMLELVLRDGTGPAYTDPSGEGLARQLALAARCLTGYAPRIGAR